MKTLDILEREHTWIGWMAACLEKLVADARADDRLPEEAYELLQLYESFADGRHQEKEEAVLFPVLLDRTGDEDRDMLGTLLSDHQAERRHMSGMRANLLGAVHGEPVCVREFAREATEYLARHRAHMHRETETLLPLTERLLTPEADALVAAGFESLEGGAGDPHGIEEQIKGLSKRTGVPAPPAA
jgi:hemerythrin-like domain-containing protein